MKKISVQFLLIVLLAAISSINGFAQAEPNAPYPPLTDLATGTYEGKQGGLYPNGSNVMPSSHLSGFAAQVARIKPLDVDGNPSNSGKIGFALVGASSPKIEFPFIEEQAKMLPNLNPNLIFINIGQGGLTYEKILDGSDRYWQSNVVSVLKQSNISNKQVQVVWLKSDSLRQGDPLTFPATPEYQKGLVKQIVQKVKQEFPNCQVIYFTARNTTVYVPNDGSEKDKHAEPRAYFNGWGIKWAIEDQIKGDPSLEYSSSAKAPIMVWGFYFWSKGDQPRSTDGYNWLRSDVNKDGVHPTDQGAEKVAARFVDAFVKDANTARWFLAGSQPPSDCPKPSWIINGKDKIAKLGRLIDERDNVKAIFTNKDGQVVLELLDIFHGCNDLNARLGRGEFSVLFYDSSGALITLNQDISYILRLK